MRPVDPGEHWLAAGITGLARQREWDAVATAEGSGSPGDEAELVALPDGRLLVETGPEGFDAPSLAAALEGKIDPPYRAVALWRPDLWTVGATVIEVARLDPDPPGDELELTWDGSAHELTIDDSRADPAKGSALQHLAAEREGGRYAAHAHRLEGDLFEVSVLPL